MNCCDANEKENKNDLKELKGGKTIKMERKIILWIVIGILFIAVLFLVFKAGVAGNVVQSAGSTAKSVASSSGMVGGC